MIDPAVAWIAAFAAGLIFASSAAIKLRNLELFESAVINYRIVPPVLARPTSYLLPIAEFAGALAVLRYASRAAGAIVLLILLAAFSIAIAINLTRGRYDVECGCFGPALRQTLSGWLILRNGALAAMVALLLLSPKPRALTIFDDFTIVCAVIAILLIYASLNYAIANLPKLREFGARYA
ncbi:MAG TPA: MauE/DoxX family redox-associated membrane protein [Candidatus Binataceae bacterium]|nr:MauE/DoxX family redox-associated membrane protein [Candidatus Binataceae bacterium]